MSVELTKREKQAMELYQGYKYDSIKVEPNNPKKAIEPDVAQSLNKKGCVTLSLSGSGRINKTPFAEITEKGKSVLLDLEIEKSSKSLGKETSKNTDVDRSSAMLLKCVCGKEMKSKSGMTLHQKKCTIFLDNPESQEYSHQDKPEEKSEEKNEETAVVSRSEEVKVIEESFLPNVDERIIVVEEDSEVIISGDVHVLERGESEYKLVNTDEITVRVKSKQASPDGTTWLLCQADGGDAFWSILEIDVVNGKYKLLSKVKENASVEDIKKFSESLEKYVEARSNKQKYNKEFTKVDKEHRPVIWEYTEKYGKETDTGRGDSKIEECGQNVHIVKTPGKDSIEYDENNMVKWLLENGYNDCIQMKPEINMWNNLKAAGKVPPEIISAFEKTVEGKDSFSLTIKSLDK